MKQDKQDEYDTDLESARFLVNILLILSILFVNGLASYEAKFL